jgi:hypothetical protein
VCRSDPALLAIQPMPFTMVDLSFMNTPIDPLHLSALAISVSVVGPANRAPKEYHP